MKLSRLIANAALIIVALAMTSGAEGKAGSITIHLKAAKGQIETFYRGKRLTDSKFIQLCAVGKEQKAEINFQRDKMNSNEALDSILKEAQCLGATHIGFTGIDQYPPKPKSSTQTHVKPPLKATALQ